MHSRGHLAVRRASVDSLGNFGAAAKPAVPELVKLLSDDDATTRVNAAVALWKIDRHPKAVPALTEMLRHGAPPEPYLSAVAIGQMGSDDDPASWVPAVAPALIAALHSTDGDVRRAASRSLGQLGTAAIAVVEKAKALEDPDSEARRLVIESLGGMVQAVAPLTAALNDNSAGVRRAASRAGQFRSRRQCGAVRAGGGGQRPGRRSPRRSSQGAKTDSRGVRNLLEQCLRDCRAFVQPRDTFFRVALQFGRNKQEMPLANGSRAVSACVHLRILLW